MAPITKNEFGVLKEGLLSQKKGARPLSRFGVDFTLTPENVILGALPVPGLNIASIVNQQRVNEIARKALGEKPRNAFDTFINPLTSGDFSATQNLQQQLIDKYGENYTRENVQDFAIENFPSLDLAKLSNIRTTTPNVLKQEGRAGINLGDNQFKVTQPYSSGSFAKYGDDYRDTLDTLTNRTNPSQLDKEFQSAMGSFAIRDMQKRFDDNLKTRDEFAEDGINQSNIKQSKNFDKDFARRVTVDQQKEQGSYGAEGTFICTALYNKGLLPRKIYMCDVIYGKKINFYTYKGYEIWGKWFAKKLQNNKTIYNIFYPIFVAWSKQMAFEVSKGKYGKNNNVLRFVKNICEKISYGIGWINERSQKWNTQ